MVNVMTFGGFYRFFQVYDVTFPRKLRRVNGHHRNSVLLVSRVCSKSFENNQTMNILLLFLDKATLDTTKKNTHHIPEFSISLVRNYF